MFKIRILKIFFLSLFQKASNKQERDESEKVVIDYLKSDPSQRGIDIPIYKVKEGLEPPHFTGFFGPWNHKYSKVCLE